MNAEIERHIKTILAALPEKPGSYQYFDDSGTIIYVGKAKNLKRRVSSYFNKEPESTKTRILVRQICDIKYIVVDTEEDALLLENSLIKQYQPRYNVLLKDDKTYPSITIKNEYFPRVFQTRSIIKDGSQYFGPYPSVSTAKIMLQMLKELYPLRTCKYPLTPESIADGKYRVCLEYHIKRCKGPCVGLQTEEEYQRNISDIKEILRGNVSEISKHLYEEMQALAGEQRFEEAQMVKEKYMARLFRRTLLNTKNAWTRRKRNCCAWASWRCVGVLKAQRVKLSFLLTWTWSWGTSRSRCRNAETRRNCSSCRK